MKFATLSHLLNQDNLKLIPKSWIKDNLIVSPELDVMGTKGYIVALNLLPQQIMSIPENKIKQIILDAAIFTQKQLGVEILQLGALTTSVTNGGVWLVKQEKYKGLVTHGDSYTAAVTCQAVLKTLDMLNKKPSELKLAIVGAYGIIGEAVSKILVPQFSHSILIGRRTEKLKELALKLEGSFNITTKLETENADVIVTATSHPTALLESKHLKKEALIVDVSQPINLSAEVCKNRPDVIRVDGGYVDFPMESSLPIPSLPAGKTFACIAEVIMQAMENERVDHVGSIDLNYLHKTEKWAEKYRFTLNELTNFGQPLNLP
jgi:predicted amino acid dehydrogenase